MVQLHIQQMIAIFWFVLKVASEECVYKECSCYEGTIDCQLKNLIQMPTPINLFGDHRSLTLGYNKITEIPAGSLPSNLSDIEIVNNPTNVIADTAFDGSAFTLQSISFTYATFTRIPDALRSLKTLQSLTIQNVNIKDWNEEAMIDISQTLESLNLDNVGLKSWPNWIHNFSHLTDLTLARGSLQSIPDGALDKLTTSLTTLSLINNSLTTIPKALSQLTALNSLNLEQNNIADVIWFPLESQLSILWLNNNKITDAYSLSQALRQTGNSLTDFDIQFNQLISIPDFSSLKRIGNIDLSYNKISNPYSGSVIPTIYSIDISHNFLPVIPEFLSTLQQITDLEFSWNLITGIRETEIPVSATLVDLGYNLITELSDNSFPNNSQLSSLHLNNNPIVKISKMAFINLAHLVELNLENTKLTRLPLALLSLTSISMFDVTDSVDLICTCQEKSLESWVMSQPPYSVLGNCGELSVYEFFKEISPYCPT